MGGALLVKNIKGKVEVFSPLSIGNVWQWYDVSQVTGVSNGSSISQLNDLSGNNLHLTQPTSNQRPIYRTNQRNGLPILDFDGNTHRMYVDYANLAQPTTVFIVYRVKSLISGNRFIFDSFNNESNRQLFYKNNANNFNWFAGSSQTAFAATTTWENVCLTFNGSTSIARRNGTLVATRNIGTSAQRGFTLGARLNHPTTNEANNIDFAELIYYNKLLNTQEIEQVENYLKTKWGF